MIEKFRGKATFADFVSRIQSASSDSDYNTSVDQIIPKQKVEKIIAKMQAKIDSLTPESFLTILSKLSNNGQNYNTIFPYLESFTNISIDVFKNNPRYVKLYIDESSGDWLVEPTETSKEELYPKIVSVGGGFDPVIQTFNVVFSFDAITSRGMKFLMIIMKNLLKKKKFQKISNQKNCLAKKM